MKKYILKSIEGYYVTALYNNSVGLSKKTEDAVELYTIKEAIVFKKLCEERDNFSLKFQILCVETTVAIDAK